MRNLLRYFAVLIAQPITGVARNVELAARVGGLTVTARLVVRAGAVYRAVVLGYVEIDRPGAQGVGQRLVGLVEPLLIVPIELLGQ